MAAGFLVGGGLFSRLTARLVGLGVRVGMRMAVVPVVTQGLVMFGENLFRDGAPEEPQNVGKNFRDATSAPSPTKKQLRHTEPKET